ncbi:MAG: alpha/beta hydrolase [Sedimentisphaerales bacterium]|nr:alpha/beta hydrolase [Sedimentisphaerales bacterium]
MERSKDVNQSLNKVKRKKKLLTTILFMLLRIYILVCIAVYLFQGKLIFFPQKLNENSPTIASHKDEEITIELDGVKLHGWLINQGNERLLIYYGGNAEEVSSSIIDLADIDKCTILALNYRGYGKSEGSPSQKALFNDAIEVFDQITAKLNILPERVILLGRSLGSGVAVHVACQRNISKLILTTPFDSVRNIAKKMLPIFPVGLLIRHPFDSVSIVDKIKAPCLMFLAENDQVIPLKNSMNLANHFTAPLDTITIKNAGHNNIQIYGLYISAINDFIDNDIL